MTIFRALELQKKFDAHFINLTLTLAATASKAVYPNPFVGSILVDFSSESPIILATGVHETYGTLHAERALLTSFAGKVPESATLYLNLEPCCHFGNTPPCVESIINYGIKRVVFANYDPNPKVSGKGKLLLEKAKIEVIPEIGKDDGEELNRRFFTFYHHKRPHIVLKWAESADGFIAPLENIPQYPISSKEARILSHKWRSEEGAILVGTNTLLIDDPELNVRHLTGVLSPKKIILPSNRLPNSRKAYQNCIFVKSKTLPDLINELCFLNIISLFVEGGATLLKSFIKAKLYDEIIVVKSSKLLLKNGIKAPPLPNDISLKRNVIIIETDFISYFKRCNTSR